MKHKSTFIRLFTFCCLFAFASFANAQEIARPLGLWPRGDRAYLAAGQSMPLWPQLPEGTKTANAHLTLTVTLPPGFQITSWGKSKAFAVLPKPLIVPSSVTETQNDAKNVVYDIEIPASELPEKGFGRLALMVNPGANPAGDYSAVLQTGDTSAKVLLTVLPPLDGKQPRRLQVGVYNYNGLTDEAWLRDMDQAVVKSGVNQIWDMRPVLPSASPQTRQNALASRLAKKGVSAGAIWTWQRFATKLGKEYPQLLRRDAQGKSDAADGIAATWIIENRDKMMPLLEEDLKNTLSDGLYSNVQLDHEVRALSRDNKTAEGDIYNPGTMEAFAKFAKLDKTPPADPAFIAAHYADQWTNFRTWQSAQLSAMLADALQNVDPLAGYGLYSGYEYAPPLQGRTHQWYSVNWHQMASEGKVQFGSAGYYGSSADIRSTAAALGEKPFIPAEMFVVNFVSHAKSLPEPDAFASRLLAAALDGGGHGVNVWYLSVLDAGAYSAIAKVSHLLADAEPFLLDGKRADDLLNLPRDIDPANVFVYQLGERRLAMVLNRSAQTMNFRAAWKDKITKPNTTELVSGKNLGDAPLMETVLKPNEFAAFLTFSDGN